MSIAKSSSSAKKYAVGVNNTFAIFLSLKSQDCVSASLNGTEGRSRTDTVSPPPDFESGASTSSATPAQSFFAKTTVGSIARCRLASSDLLLLSRFIWNCEYISVNILSCSNFAGFWMAMLEFVDCYTDLLNPVVIDEAQRVKKIAIGKEATLGDSHGNTMRIIRELELLGVLELTAKQFQQLYAIYAISVDQLTADAIANFSKLLTEITYHPHQLQKIRLLGDTLADRGANDLFTLALFKQLHLHKINFTIIISNHDTDFVRFYENNHLSDYAYVRGTIANNYGAPGIVQHQSMLNCSQLIADEKISLSDVNDLVTNDYNPHLKLFDYYLFQNSEQAAIQLFTHAPVSLWQMREAAKLFNIETTKMFDSTLQLALTIEKINIEYLQLIQQKSSYARFLSLETVQTLLWNRDDITDDLRVSFDYQFIHGHTKNIDNQRYHSLDGLLGKSQNMSVGVSTIAIVDG